jgi:hypothetical protein
MMSEERLSALEAGLSKVLEAGGASVTIQDPRVNTWNRWIATLMGGIALLVMAWVATSINDLNATMSRLVAQNEAVVSILGDHSDRIKELERRNAGR